VYFNVQQYAKVRENKQEAFYNLARAAHHLGLHLLAQRWYHQALEAEVPAPWQLPDSDLLGVPPPPLFHALLSCLPIDSFSNSLT